MNSFPFVSVIIPVYNDGERLKLTLNALESQTYPRDQFEVVVVDNASDQPPDVSDFPRVKLVNEPKIGSYAARNTGLAAARGDYLAFTDADCLPQADWLENGIRRLMGEANCGLVSGPVTIFCPEPNRPTWAEAYELYFGFPVKEYVERLHICATGNLFTHRDVFAKIGRFDEARVSGADADWGQRVFAAGFKLIYDETVVIQHPARRTIKQLLYRHRRFSVGYIALARAKSKLPLMLNYRIYRHFLPPVKPLWKILRAQNVRLKNKLKIGALIVLIRCVNAYEVIRALLGLKSNVR